MAAVSPDIWLAFAVAAFIVLCTPGPSTMLALAHGLRFGSRRAAMTVAGIISADATHVVIVISGMSAILTASVAMFQALKWLGVIYLVYLGIRFWRASPSEVGADGGGRGQGGRFAEGYLVTLTNPKPIMFHLAFLPQFVDPAGPQQAQLVLFGVTFLVLAGLVLSGYAFFAGRLRRALAVDGRALWLNRAAGSLLIAAAMALAGLRRA